MFGYQMLGFGSGGLAAFEDPLSLNPATPWYTDQAGVKSTAGRDIVAASSMYMSNATTIGVSTSFTAFGWNTPDTNSGVRTLIGCWQASNQSWIVYQNGADLVFQAGLSSGDRITVTISSVISSSTEYFWACGYDASTGNGWLRYNSTTGSDSRSSGNLGGTASLIMGSSFGTNYYDGIIYRVGFSTTYYGATSSEVNAIYALGPTDSVTAQEEMTLTNFWALDEASGTGYDSIGALDLTANNSPVGVVGALSTATNCIAADASGGPAITLWETQGTGGQNFTQSTLASCPQLRTYGVYFDGTDDTLEYSGLLTNADTIVYMIGTPEDVASYNVIWGQYNQGANSTWIHGMLNNTTAKVEIATATPTDGTQTSASVSNGVESIIGWGSDGVDYELYLDSSAEATKSGGTDNGTWANDITGMTSTVFGAFKGAVNLYAEGTVREFIFPAIKPSASQHSDIWTWLEGR